MSQKPSSKPTSPYETETLGQYIQRTTGWGKNEAPASDNPAAEARDAGLDVEALVKYAQDRYGD